ncbi:MAG: phosphatidylglycerophosphatase A [Opitutales bacterium]
MFKLRKFIALLGKQRVINIARLAPIGDLPAPGTFGSIAGIFFYVLVLFYLPTIPLIIVSAILAYIAINLCDLAEEYMHAKDPSDIVLDEFVAIPLCFIGINWAEFGSYSFIIIFLGFALFRFFDILKPLGIKKVQNLKGGLGCVIDDTLAALASCVCLHLIIYLYNYN